MKNTKVEIIQSICLSYVYLIMLSNVPSHNIIQKNFFLIVISVLVGYLAYVITSSSILLTLFKSANVHTSTAKNEIDFLLGGERKPLWLRVYLKDTSLIYEGWLIGHDLEQGSNRFIILSKYRKYLSSQDGTLGECIADHDSEEEKIIIYYDNISRIEKRDAE